MSMVAPEVWVLYICAKTTIGVSLTICTARLPKPSVSILASSVPVLGTRILASTVFAGIVRVWVQPEPGMETVTVAAHAV